MLANFEQLSMKCQNDESKSQIVEAIKCYEAGSYRAAILMAYIAVCYDLIDKLRALAAIGDGACQNKLSDLTKHQEQYDRGNSQAISGLLNFEKELIEFFRDSLDFFGASEFRDLARLREDRNRCAHPTFIVAEQNYLPTAELARLHISNALNLVLTQRPRQGKAALELFRQTISSQYFPTISKEAAASLSGIGMDNARDSLVRAIVDDIIFGLVDKDHLFYKKIYPYVALEGIMELHKDIVVGRSTQNLGKLLSSGSDEAIEIASYVVLRCPDLPPTTNDASRTAVRNWVLQTKTANAGNAVRKGLEIDWLEHAARTRLNTLTAVDFSKTNPEMPDEMLKKSAEIYCEARNWDKANELADLVAIPFAAKFKIEHIRYIFDQARNGDADLPGSHKFREFIGALYNENSTTKDDLDELTQEFDLAAYRP